MSETQKIPHVKKGKKTLVIENIKNFFFKSESNLIVNNCEVV